MTVFGTAIDEDQALQVFDVSDEEQASIVLTLPLASRVDVRRTNAKTFDDIEDMMKFIQAQRKASDRSYDVYFQVRAYEIVREHYMKLYYEKIVSGA